MKKYLLLLLPIISNGNNIIDDIKYNGISDSNELYYNSTIQKGEELNISKIDRLVDNFKFSKSNDVKVDIEPSEKEGHINILVNNKKKSNSLTLSVGVDNYGNSIEDGIYRYNIELGSSGIILNENVNISYTFVSPKNPIREEKEELGIGESIEEKDISSLEKARINNNLNIDISFPIRDREYYITYNNSYYKKSIIGNNDIYDISGSGNKLDTKIKYEVYREKKNKINLIGKYSYTHKESNLEDVLLTVDNITDIGLGIEYIEEGIKIESVYLQRYFPYIKHILNTDISLSKQLDNDTSIGLDVKSVIERRNSSLNVKGKLNYKAIYTEAGFNTDYVNINPIIKMGLKSSFENISLDTSLNYDKELKWLFNLKYNIF